MPRGSPFTAMCQSLAALSRPVVADLHLHTTASDGDYTPSQVVAFARQAKLSAIAITDHDTLAGVVAAREAALGTALTVVAGVECSAELAGREFHILGYFVRPDDPEFHAALVDVCRRRRERFEAFVFNLKEQGIHFTPGVVESLISRTPSLGRRHLAGLLVQSETARSRYEAFKKFVIPITSQITPSHLTPAQLVIEQIHAAGGFASLAHPSQDCDDATVTTLRDLGMDAIEVNFPAATVKHSRNLRAIAQRLGMIVTGGSDCHGGESASRMVGCKGLNRTAWEATQRDGAIRNHHAV